MEHIDISNDNGVGILTMHHEQQNRFTTPFLEEFLQALKAFDEDPSIKSVIITSAHEKYFSTGLHLEWLMMQAAGNQENVRAFLETLNRFLKTLLVFPKPTIAAINGHAIGAGVFLAACADFRYMRSDRGFISLPEVRMNLAFWPGVTALLKELLPHPGFRDLAYTGDNFNSEQAHTIGFIDACVPMEKLLTETLSKAAQLCEQTSGSYASIKQDRMRQVLHTMEVEDPMAIEEYMASIAP